MERNKNVVSAYFVQMSVGSSLHRINLMQEFSYFYIKELNELCTYLIRTYYCNPLRSIRIVLVKISLKTSQ